MNRFFVLILVLLVSSFLYSTEDDFDFKDLPQDIKYCQVVGVSFALDTPPVITINFGQKFVARKVIKREGKVFSFNNMIDVLNWMYANGWEYQDYFILNTGMGGYWHYYLLKRKE
jgi:hypothetical protein